MTRYYCNVGHYDVEKQIQIANKLATKYGVNSVPLHIIKSNRCLQFTWYSDSKYMMFRDMTYSYKGIEVSAGCNNLGEM